MTYMKSYFARLAVAALLATGPTVSSHAEDTAAPKAPAAPQSEAPPPSVPRPSLAPKTAEPATVPAASKTAEPDAKSASDERPRHRRYVRRYRHGYYRTAYWQPFPIYWPHVYRSRIHWNRIPWAFRF
jgi:hypothetical protein